MDKESAVAKDQGAPQACARRIIWGKFSDKSTVIRSSKRSGRLVPTNRRVGQSDRKGRPGDKGFDVRHVRRDRWRPRDAVGRFWVGRQAPAALFRTQGGSRQEERLQTLSIHPWQARGPAQSAEQSPTRCRGRPYMMSSVT